MRDPPCSPRRSHAACTRCARARADVRGACRGPHPQEMRGRTPCALVARLESTRKPEWFRWRDAKVSARDVLPRRAAAVRFLFPPQAPGPPAGHYPDGPDEKITKNEPFIPRLDKCCVHSITISVVMKWSTPAARLPPPCRRQVAQRAAGQGRRAFTGSVGSGCAQVLLRGRQ